MLKNFVVAILFSLICNSFALDQTFSPVLIFTHKENTETISQFGISATTQVNQGEFEERLQTLAGNQKVILFVANDLSPEKFNVKNEDGIRALQNTATESRILEYIPYVENAVDNKETNGKSVDRVSISTTNELEPKPKDGVQIIVVKLPERLPTESDFHCLSRYDRIIHAITHSDEYKDAIFILSSEQNSQLQQEEHSRKRRAAGDSGHIYSDKIALVYFNDFLERSKNEKTPDASASLSVSGATLNEHVIDVHFTGKYDIVLQFQYDPYTESWALTPSGSKINNQQLNASSIGTVIEAPKDFSFSCAESIFIPLENNKELVGVYFKNFQVQFNFDNQGGDAIVRFGDSYDCIGFTNVAILAGLFITFLLLFIIATGITYIMDIRTMDRFDDPKGKTITVTASE